MLLSTKRASRKWLRALFPQDIRCIVCGSEREVLAGYSVCAVCRACMPMRRNAPLKLIAGEHLVQARACMDYVGQVRDLIHLFKYGNRPYLAHNFSYFLRDELQRSGWPQPDLILGVPLHPKRRRARGYDQAQLLGLELGERMNIAASTKCLQRAKATRSQTELTPVERRKNVENAFVTGKQPVQAKRILLVDDVLTTGATADACAKCLLEAGAKEVYALALASTQFSI